MVLLHLLLQISLHLTLEVDRTSSPQSGLFDIPDDSLTYTFFIRVINTILDYLVNYLSFLAIRAITEAETSYVH